ncbi:MAG: VOC family protein [Alphaproteobacteria bacterium]|jgi:catechol 2,3-dioxygenase-like lactoylglutathione lyase family enzyme|nr:VOC family protein [Alphaproteobacteria bacterium]
MRLHNLDHMTIRCRPQDLPAVEQFYGQVLGLKPGRRPDFDFPGIWFYLGDCAVVHIAARLDELPESKGTYDHVSFKASGIAETRARFDAMGVAYGESPVPGFPLHQIFLTDPTGAKVELTFDLPA